MFKKSEKDARHVNRVTAAFLSACESVDPSFIDMSVDEKRSFIEKKYEAIVANCCKIDGSYEALHTYNVYLMENQGCATLYFSKK